MKTINVNGRAGDKFLTYALNVSIDKDYESLAAMSNEFGLEASEEDKILDSVAGFALGRTPEQVAEYMSAVADLYEEALWRAPRKAYGNHAANIFLGDLYAGLVQVKAVRQRDWIDAELNTREAIATGLIGSFASYNKSHQAAASVPLFRELIKFDPLAAKLLMLGDAAPSAQTVQGKGEHLAEHQTSSS